jgi:hypothetical protein
MTDPHQWQLPPELDETAMGLPVPKPGLVMGIATERLSRKTWFPRDASQPLSVPDWHSFCDMVWQAEAPWPCRLITRHKPAITMDVPSDSEIAYCGKAEWGPEGPIIEVDDDGLTRLTALHEIAHLLVDADRDWPGHRPPFARSFVGLLARWISLEAAADWWVEWTQALSWALDHPGWPPS